MERLLVGERERLLSRSLILDLILISLVSLGLD